jgi:hypothetical protein
MKQLEVPFLQVLDRTTSIEKISDSLNRLNKHPVEMLPWMAFSYKPEVSFALAHANDCLFLEFYVTESRPQANYSSTNDPVYKDSCVEFFIAFNEEAVYYNFEFNCLGTCMAAYGTERDNRKFLPAEVIAQIKSLATIKQLNSYQQGLFFWRLTLMIPVEVFCMHELTQLKGLACKVNFFKCGDELQKQHYLSWNDIKADKPNFHLPEFFGKMNFA